MRENCISEGMLSATAPRVNGALCARDFREYIRSVVMMGGHYRVVEPLEILIDIRVTDFTGHTPPFYIVERDYTIYSATYISDGALAHSF